MDARARLQRAAKRYEDAKAERERAKVERERAIRAAAAEGLTRRAIASEVGLTFQRVEQIIKQEPARAEVRPIPKGKP